MFDQYLAQQRLAQQFRQAEMERLAAQARMAKAARATNSKRQWPLAGLRQWLLARQAKPRKQARAKGKKAYS